MYRPNSICYRLNCNVYRPNLHISDRFLGGPPGPGCGLEPVGAGRGRSGPVGDGNAGGGPRNVRNSGSAGTVGSVAKYGPKSNFYRLKVLRIDQISTV